MKRPIKHRRERVAHDLRARLGDILERHVSDPRLARVTVSGVETSSDLTLAKVYLFVPERREEALEALERAKPFLRRRLGEGLRLRRVPELAFFVDESLERGERIDQLLKELGFGESGGEGAVAAPTDEGETDT